MGRQVGLVGSGGFQRCGRSRKRHWFEWQQLRLQQSVGLTYGFRAGGSASQLLAVRCRIIAGVQQRMISL